MPAASENSLLVRCHWRKKICCCLPKSTSYARLQSLTSFYFRMVFQLLIEWHVQMRTIIHFNTYTYIVDIRFSAELRLRNWKERPKRKKKKKIGHVFRTQTALPKLSPNAFLYICMYVRLTKTWKCIFHSTMGFSKANKLKYYATHAWWSDPRFTSKPENILTQTMMVLLLLLLLLVIQASRCTFAAADCCTYIH